MLQDVESQKHNTNAIASDIPLDQSMLGIRSLGRNTGDKRKIGWEWKDLYSSFILLYYLYLHCPIWYLLAMCSY
jgi:uncharacterized protein (DUF608 family)